MSVFENSLIKAGLPGSPGTGPSGPATIDGWPFTIDPTSVQLPIRAKVQKFRTIGGFVVQVYGTTWGDLSITGQFGGVHGPFGTGGWELQLKFLEKMLKIAQDQSMQRRAAPGTGQNFSPAQPFLFHYPLLGWRFYCYLKAFTTSDGPLAVHIENPNINPKWTLTLFIVTDNGGLEPTKKAYLQRLAPGLGVMWDSKTVAQGGQTWQGYTDDKYNSPLGSTDVQNYVNSPTGLGSVADVVPSSTSTFTGPNTTPPPAGTAPDGTTTINTSADFAKAFLKAIGAPVNTTTTNLVRAWEYAEGMWSQGNLSDTAAYPGGWYAWGAPYMNNPLNIGGWTGPTVNGSHGTYPAGKVTYNVTYLWTAVTGTTFSFTRNWTNGLNATVYAIQNEGPPEWRSIITALQNSDTTSFFNNIGYWNDPSTGAPAYAAKVQKMYNDPAGMANANY